MADHHWIRVTRDAPCPICKKPDWCMIARDKTAVICPRSTDQPYHRMTHGGPLFRLDKSEHHTPLPRQYPEYEQMQPTEVIDWRVPILNMLTGTTDVQRKDLSESIGVGTDTLMRLEACYSPDSQTWGFPIRTLDDKYVGCLLRKRDRDVRSRWRKWCVKGSKLGIGLHIPRDVHLGPTTDLYPPTNDAAWNQCVLCIAEGVTDTGILLDYGFNVIGRTSCSSGLETLSEIRNRIVWIFADDDPKEKANPGHDGAVALATRLFERNLEVRVIRPMAGKDVRQWVMEKKPLKSTLIAVANNAPKMTEHGLK